MLTNEAVEALARVARTADQLKLGRSAIRAHVEAARRAGASWESIGRMLGCSKQAAARTYGARVNAAKVEQGVCLF